MVPAEPIPATSAAIKTKKRTLDKFPHSLSCGHLMEEQDTVEEYIGQSGIRAVRQPSIFVTTQPPSGPKTVREYIERAYVSTLAAPDRPFTPFSCSEISASQLPEARAGRSARLAPQVPGTPKKKGASLRPRPLLQLVPR
jgi:hypothetical protein